MIPISQLRVEVAFSEIKAFHGEEEYGDWLNYVEVHRPETIRLINAKYEIEEYVHFIDYWSWCREQKIKNMVLKEGKFSIKNSRKSVDNNRKMSKIAEMPKIFNLLWS